MSTANIHNRMQIWVIFLLIITTANGCTYHYEVDTKPIVSGGNPPIIEFEGTGALAQLFVMGPYTLEQLKQDKIDGDGKDYYMWQLDPSRDFRVSELSITYGIVPNGFKQVYPVNGKSPEPLIEGKIYNILAPSASANFKPVLFMIDNGRAVEVPPGQITDK